METQVTIPLSTYIQIYDLLDYIGYYADTDICDGNKLRIVSDDILSKLEPPSYYEKEN
jgi:hypothetical protein